MSQSGPTFETKLLAIMMMLMGKLTYAISCVCFSEKGTLNLWVTLAIEYYRRGKRDEFVRILDVARVDANLGYPNSDEDQVQLFQ